MSAKEPRVAVVTGANRGIGLEVCRQLAERGMTVILTSRDRDRGEAAATGLAQRGLDVRARPLDVADATSAERFAGWAREHLGHVDVLVNNAAIDYDTDQRAVAADLERVERAWQTNTLGAWRITLALLPLLRAGTHARIVNVSSEAGSISEIGPGTPGYRVTKAALNALTRIVASELRGERILVNAVCPGWTATEMGGGGRAIPAGAASVIWAAVLQDDGPTGGFFRDGQALAW
ncbi:MAG: SDR family oxidoreductase [Solirubrobacteraceae bacterium]|jgi:NAD(P)-dependent dehydrogenase (short-subunit alcohol dehydrogenase family)